jgi:plastocyanin
MHRYGSGLLAAGLALALVACPANDTNGPAPDPNDEADATVIIENIEFDTDAVTISAGETVAWINEDAMGHTITHGSQGAAVDDPLFDEPVDAGESFSFTFDEPGEYEVTCTIHPTKNMTVVVE